MSSEILRSAARLMRARAEAASPGPWHVCEEPSVDSDSAVTNADHDPVAALMDEWYEVDPNEPTAVHDAAHIASWHPAVALAVADWLEATADHADTTGGHCVCDDAALAVADAYLSDGSAS